MMRSEGLGRDGFIQGLAGCSLTLMGDLKWGVTRCDLYDLCFEENLLAMVWRMNLEEKKKGRRRIVRRLLQLPMWETVVDWTSGSRGNEEKWVDLAYFQHECRTHRIV